MRIILHIIFICSALAVCLTGRVEASGQQQQQQPSAPGAHSAPRHPSQWWKTPKYMQELKLTAKQSAELDQIIQASRARMTADKEDLDRAQSDFRQLMERPDTNQRELLKAAERLEMARYSIAKERTMMGVRIHSVLTPDQRRGLDAIAKRHEADRNRQSQTQGQKQNQR
jgi:Spy/CpxP family protein refolding chaperone